MDRPALPAPPPFGGMLRRWRGHRGLTQEALALQAEVSTRHLSWLETGKAEPSRAMVLRLATQLEVPLRERNAWLAAAGYAPLYRDSDWAGAALAPAREALQRLLDAHEPWPALAVDRHWNLVAANRMLPLLLRHAAPELLQPPLNVLRVSLHPRGVAPMIANLAAWREHVLTRLQRQIAVSHDPVLVALHAELLALPGPAADTEAPAAGADDWAVPLLLDTPAGRLNFISTMTVFGAPHELTVAELAVETLLPADAATAQRLRELLESSLTS